MRKYHEVVGVLALLVLFLALSKPRPQLVQLLVVAVHLGIWLIRGIFT